MKRVIAFLLLAVFCFVSFDSVAFAAETEQVTEVETEESYFSILSKYTCDYHRETRQITLSGTVKHDALISHKQYRVEVYRVAPGESYESVITAPNAKPLVSAEIASRFEFTWKSESVMDRYARYAIVLCSPIRERNLLAPLLYPTEANASVYDPADRSSFKGIYSSEISLASNLKMGTAIVPVYLDRLIQNTSYGYMYQVGERTVYLDKNYIYELDRAVRTYSATGTRVYLQLLLSAGSNELSIANGKPMGASYEMPNVYSEDILARICGCAEFLSERFITYQNGKVSGVIVGDSIDDPMMNYCGSLSLERYADMYALYLMAVTFSVRAHQPALDVVIPFSDTDVYSSQEQFGGTYSPTKLFEQVLRIVEESNSTPLAYGTMVLCDVERQSTSKLSVERMSKYSEYLADLRASFACAPTHYMVRWNVPAEMGATALCANYAYSYYSLFGDGTLSSFVVSFSACEANGTNRLTELKQILRWIDTKDSMNVTSSLPSYFGKTAWDEMIPGVSGTSYETHVTLPAQVNASNIPTITGSFSYFDFSNGHIEDWFAGMSCTGVKAEYGQEGKRVLRATFQPVEGDAYGELMCLYEYPERLAHTPFLDFRMALAEESGDQNGLYQIMITMGNDSYRTVAQTICKGSEIQTVRIGFGQFPADQLVNYVKISVRQIEGEAKDLSFRLYDVTGHSALLSSEELAERIEADRMNIRNLTATDEAAVENRWWIIGVILIAVLVMISVFACFRREDDSEDTE